MYYVYCLHSRRTVKNNLTIQEAFNEIKHVGGFGIANSLTNQVLVYKTFETFRVARRFENKQLPKINRSRWF